jgi:hypothetical protein
MCYLTMAYVSQMCCKKVSYIYIYINIISCTQWCLYYYYHHHHNNGVNQIKILAVIYEEKKFYWHHWLALALQMWACVNKSCLAIVLGEVEGARDSTNGCWGQHANDTLAPERIFWAAVGTMDHHYLDVCPFWMGVARDLKLQAVWMMVQQPTAHEL